MKSLILSLLYVSSMSYGMQIPSTSIYSMSDNKPVVSYKNDNFWVKNGSDEICVGKQNLNPVLRNMTQLQIKSFMKNGYIKVSGSGENTLLNGEYRLKGGGVVGAGMGAWFGYGSTFIICHSAIAGVSTLIAGPIVGAGVAAFASKLLAAPIHMASLTAGVACGITAGVATGPV